MRHFLGIDGGGSKCYAALLNEHGQVRGWGRGGPTTYQPGVDAAACWEQAVEGALAPSAPEELWVGEIWQTAERVHWFRERGIRAHIGRVHEKSVCLLHALCEYGVVVHAGTGNFVYTRTREGCEAIIGGLGPILGEEGAGWDIGLRGLKAGLRSPWTRETRTRLAASLPAALGVNRLLEVVGRPIYTGQISRARIAALAPTVIAEAEAGDRVAVRVLSEAADALAEIVRLALHEHDLVGRGYPLIGIAGLIQASPYYWRMLRGRILRHDPSLQATVPPVRMCVAAAFEMMRREGIPITAGLRDQAVASQQAYAGATVATQDQSTCCKQSTSMPSVT